MTRDVMDLIPNAAHLEALSLASGSAEWLAERRKGIGGSDVAAVLKLSPWTTPLALWRQKTGLDPDTAPSWPMRVGTALESEIAASWAEEAGATLYRVPMLVDAARPWRRVNIDRLAVLPDGRVLLIEVKWDSRGRIEEAPDYYWTQVQWGLHIAGLTQALLIVGSPFRSHLTIPVAYDHDTAAQIADAVDSWWHAHVVANDAPEPSNDDERASVAISRLRSGNGALKADEALDLAVRQMLAEEAAIEAAEAQVKAKRAALYEAMDAAGASRVESASGWTAALQPRRGQIRYADAVKSLGISVEALSAFRGPDTQHVVVRQKGAHKEG